MRRPAAVVRVAKRCHRHAALPLAEVQQPSSSDPCEPTRLTRQETAAGDSGQTVRQSMPTGSVSTQEADMKLKTVTHHNGQRGATSTCTHLVKPCSKRAPGGNAREQAG